MSLSHTESGCTGSLIEEWSRHPELLVDCVERLLIETLEGLGDVDPALRTPVNNLHAAVVGGKVPKVMNLITALKSLSDRLRVFLDDPSWSDRLNDLRVAWETTLNYLKSLDPQIQLPPKTSSCTQGVLRLSGDEDPWNSASEVGAG